MSHHGQDTDVFSSPGHPLNNLSYENKLSTEQQAETAFMGNQQHQIVPGKLPLHFHHEMPYPPGQSPGSPYPPPSPFMSGSPYPGPPRASYTPSQQSGLSYPPPSPYLDPTRFSYPPTYSPSRSPDQMFHHQQNEANNTATPRVRFQSEEGSAGQGPGYYPMAGAGVVHPPAVYPPPLPGPGPGPSYPPIQAAGNPANHPGNFTNRSHDGQRIAKAMASRGSNPVRLTCPLCSEDIVTQVTLEPGALTWIACCLLFLLTGFCCIIPFMIKGCKETIHKCPRCGLVLNK